MHIINEPFDISFPETGLVLLEGRNGSGKTAVMKAIAWCLYGKLTDICPKNEVTSARKSTIVTLTTKDISITRSTNPCELIIKRDVNGIQQIDPLPGSQEIINRLFGSENIWHSYSYLPYRSNHLLTKSTTTDRYDLISRLAFGHPDSNRSNPEIFLHKAKETVKSYSTSLIGIESISSHLRNDYVNIYGCLPETNDVLDVKILEEEFRSLSGNLKVLEDSKIRAVANEASRREKAMNIEEATNNLEESKAMKSDIFAYLKDNDLFAYLSLLNRLNNIAKFDSVDEADRVISQYNSNEDVYDFIECTFKHCNNILETVNDEIDKFTQFNARETWNMMSSEWSAYQRWLNTKCKIEKLKSEIDDKDDLDVISLSKELSLLRYKLTNEIICPKCSYGFTGTCPSQREEMSCRITELEQALHKAECYKKNVSVINNLEMEVKDADRFNDSIPIDPHSTFDKKPECINPPKFITNEEKMVLARRFKMLMNENVITRIPSKTLATQADNWKSLMMDMEDLTMTHGRLKNTTRDMIEKEIHVRERIRIHTDTLDKSKIALILLPTLTYDQKLIDDTVVKLRNCELLISKSKKQIEAINAQYKVRELATRLASVKKLQDIFEEMAREGMRSVMRKLTGLINEMLSRMFTTVPVRIDISENDSKSRKINVTVYKGDVIWNKLEALSGGEKTMISLAMCIAMDNIGFNGNILMLDETFNAIDMVNREACLEILKEHAMNKCIINVCHDIDRTDHEVIVIE